MIYLIRIALVDFVSPDAGTHRRGSLESRGWTCKDASWGWSGCHKRGGLRSEVKRSVFSTTSIKLSIPRDSSSTFVHFIQQLFVVVLGR